MPGIQDLKNKVVVITGAGSGIGRAPALVFARTGSILVIADNNDQRLETVRVKHGGKTVSRMTEQPWTPE